MLSKNVLKDVPDNLIALLCLPATEPQTALSRKEIDLRKRHASSFSAPSPLLLLQTAARPSPQHSRGGLKLWRCKGIRRCSSFRVWSSELIYISFLNSPFRAGNMAIKGVPETMQAVQIVEFNKPHELREIPTPTKLGPHDLLVKIAVASLCHSDLEYQAGAIRGSTLPVIASHEGCGIVAAVGDAVTNFKIGDRVLAGQTYGRCGECDDCNGPENYKHYCGVAWASPMGGGRNGAFSDYHITDARESTHLPDNVSFETAAPLACAGITVWRAVLQTELEPESGKWIGIVGSGGGLGHIGIQFAKARGLKVVAIDASDNGIALSKEMGADVVIDARLGKDAVVQKVMEVTNRQGVDASTCLTDAKVAPSVSCGITKRHGIMVQIAVVSTSVQDRLRRR